MQRLIVAALLLITCDSGFARSAARWTPEMVFGLHFTLVDPIRIEDYVCSKAGTVSVVLGTRSEITPPLWYWRIRDGRLQFSDGNSIKEDFTLLSMSENVLTVRRRSGEIAKFHYKYEKT
jgi:hypothetical protein